MTHLNCWLKNLGKTFKLQKEILKSNMNHDEIDENNFMKAKMSGYFKLNKTYYVLLFHMHDTLELCKK